MFFSEWISKYRSENNQLGVLARVILGDMEFPEKSKNEKIIRNRLIELKIGLPTMRAFNNAYRRYSGRSRGYR